jgi:hypothetical protein
MVRICPPPPVEKPFDERAPSADELDQRLMRQAEQLVAYARDPRAGDEEMTFKQFEQSIIPRVFELGCTVVALFLTCCESRVRERIHTRLVQAGRTFQRKSPEARTIMTWFGYVRYWRTYMLEKDVANGRGFFPLDHVLGLTSDRFGFNMLAVVVRLATTLSFATAKSTAELFLPEVPATEVIEKATLGFGRFTSKWFEFAPAPDDDGDVLVIQVDSKGTPQATEEELELRRGPRPKDRPKADSPRHRERRRRNLGTKKKRPAKEDKSKNARMATMVVMYTLRSVGTKLHGPINKWVYASFAPKKHAFAIAWREAKKRGFDPEGEDVIQIVTDGDDDLSRYAKLFFPNAIHTLDIMHVIERLWKAGACLYKSGSEELEEWIEEQKELLYGGDIKEVISELRKRRRALCRSQKNKKRREILMANIKYLDKRVDMMNYAELVDEDLEIGSGAIEGAIKHVIGKRCDQGGMRWIVERNEAVVQLRCIEVNGDWERFTAFVHDRIRQKQLEDLCRVRLQQDEPESLPDLLNPPEWKAVA